MTHPQQPVVVFCWRGGERSRAVTNFLCLAGLAAQQLRGGHKLFRRHVQTYFEQGQWGRLLVLRGLTGVGKTRTLHRLAQRGVPILDLEGLANHRGSAFGALGLPPQPSQKQFEALLWDALRQLPPTGYLVTEGESRQIGRLRLPARLFQALQTETSLWLTANLDYRVQVVLEDYPAASRDKVLFAAPILGLKRRLGSARVDAYLALLAADRWDDLVRELMVDYYDPLYLHALPARRREIAIDQPDGLDRLRQVLAELLTQAPPEPEL
jgi:tRNA 2-selenouridine synthase